MVLWTGPRPGGNTDPRPFIIQSDQSLPSMAKSRNWCFTINNPDESFELPSSLKMLLANRETGASGTPHYQGYAEFNNPVALSHLRNWNPSGHYEIRKGTQSQAILYCVKDFLNEVGEPGSIFDVSLEALEGFGLKTYGLDKTQLLSVFLKTLCDKKVSKLTQLKLLIDEGWNDKQIADYDFDTWCRSHRALTQYRLMCVTPRNWEMEVVVIYGPTGTGKSKYCNDSFPNCYWKQRGKWWDNYAQQDAVCLDEFYGWLQWDVLLRLADRYPLLVETKGGQVQFSSKQLIFTSNTEPSKWYKEVYFDAFVRRVTRWIYMPRLGVQREFIDYKEFLSALNEAVYIAQL